MLHDNVRIYIYINKCREKKESCEIGHIRNELSILKEILSNE
jgi:hypothetical protein